jgi:hypothetical protein
VVISQIGAGVVDKERDDFERAKEFERIKEDARRKEIEESFPFIPRSASR